MQEFEIDLHYLGIDFEDEFPCDEEMDNYANINDIIVSK